MMGAVNYVTTIVKMRAPGMTWFKMPLFCWGAYATAIIQVLATPVLAITLLLLLAELAQPLRDLLEVAPRTRVAVDRQRDPDQPQQGHQCQHAGDQQLDLGRAHAGAVGRRERGGL